MNMMRKRITCGGGGVASCLFSHDFGWRFRNVSISGPSIHCDDTPSALFHQSTRRGIVNGDDGIKSDCSRIKLNATTTLVCFVSYLFFLIIAHMANSDREQYPIEHDR